MSPTALCPERLLLLAAVLPLAWLAGPAALEEDIVFPETLNGSVWPGPGTSARLRCRLAAFGERLLLELEQDAGVRAEGLTLQYLGRAPAPLGGAEPGTYLTGTVNGDPESVASLHWDGAALLGVLQYQGAELHLQPLDGGSPNSAGGPGAHILRRKRPTSDQGPMCNVQGSPMSPGHPSPGPRRAKVGSALCHAATARPAPTLPPSALPLAPDLDPLPTTWLPRQTPALGGSPSGGPGPVRVLSCTESPWAPHTS